MTPRQLEHCLALKYAHVVPMSAQYVCTSGFDVAIASYHEVFINLHKYVFYNGYIGSQRNIQYTCGTVFNMAALKPKVLTSKTGINVATRIRRLIIYSWGQYDDLWLNA